MGVCRRRSLNVVRFDVSVKASLSGVAVRHWGYAGPVARLALVSALARVPAFVVPLAIAAVFGAGTTTDAYFLVYAGVLLIGGTLAQGIEQAVVPFVSRAAKQGTAMAFAVVAALRATLAAAVLWGTAVAVTWAVAGEDQRHMLLPFAVAFGPLVMAWASAAAFAGALVSADRIATATGSLLWRGVGAAVGLSAYPLGGGLHAVAVGLGAGEIARVWWLHRAAKRTWGLGTGAGAAEVRRFDRAAVAQAAGGSAIGAAQLVERVLVSTLGVGAVSHLEYAVRLLVIPAVLFEGAIAPSLLARWSAHVAAHDAPPATRAALARVLATLALAGVVAVAVAGLADPIVRMLLGHGRFTDQDVATVSELVRWLALPFVFTMGALILERHYLALSRNRLLAILAAGRSLLRLSVVIVCLPAMSLKALALAYGVADGAYLLTLIVLMPRRRESPAPVVYS